MRSYYDRRAREYDDWWLGRGLSARRERPGSAEEVAALERAVVALAAARTRWLTPDWLPASSGAGECCTPGAGS